MIRRSSKRRNFTSKQFKRILSSIVHINSLVAACLLQSNQVDESTKTLILP